MSTNELNIFLNSFDRPTHVSDVAWQQVIQQAKRVWDAYLKGEDWNDVLDITCKESYLMLVSHEGKLIVQGRIAAALREERPGEELEKALGRSRFPSHPRETI